MQLEMERLKKQNERLKRQISQSAHGSQGPQGHSYENTTLGGKPNPQTQPNLPYSPRKLHSYENTAIGHDYQALPSKGASTGVSKGQPIQRKQSATKLLAGDFVWQASLCRAPTYFG